MDIPLLSFALTRGYMVVGFALGSGSKDSFQLRAIKFLYARGTKQDMIKDISVRAINGIKHAEGERKTSI